jgi:hypothetical protein
MRRIREKIKNNETHVLGSEPKKTPRPKAEVVDLMDALKNSLKQRANLALGLRQKRRGSENAPDRSTAAPFPRSERRFGRPRRQYQIVQRANLIYSIGGF